MSQKTVLFFLCMILAVLGFSGQEANAQLKPGDPIVIGVPTPLGSINGRGNWMAIQMAVDEINAKGGVKVGKEMHLMKAYAIDTRDHEPEIPVHDALNAVEKIMLERKPHAIISGAFRSEVLIASMDLVAKYKIPYFATIAMTPVLQSKVVEDYEKYKYMFRTCISIPHFIMYLTNNLAFLRKEFGYNRVHIIVQDVLWTQGSGKAVEKWCKDQGWTVTGFDAYPTGSSDFSPSLMKIKAEKAQVVVPIFDMPQSITLLKQAAATKVPTIFCGEINPTLPLYTWEANDGAVDGMINIIFDAATMPVKAVPRSLTFWDNFGKKWGNGERAKLTSHGAGQSYDSVYILADAIERAQTVEPGALVSAIEKTDMSGSIGRIKFGKDHQVIYGTNPKETAFGGAFQWKKPGKRVIVYPEAAAEGKIELPSYVKGK